MLWKNTNKLFSRCNSKTHSKITLHWFCIMFLSSMPTESYSFKYSSQLSLFLDLAERIPQNKYSSQVTANQIWCPVTCRLFTKVNITVLGCVCCAVRSCFSRVRLSLTLWTVVCQVPLTMGFFRQEYWGGLPCLPPGDFPDPKISPSSLMPTCIAGGFFTTSATWLRTIKNKI